MSDKDFAIEYPLKVTYAVAGLEDDDAPTVLFISAPHSAESTPVPLAERIDTWLLTLPALVAHLKCKHIVPLAGSAGTVYLLNCLYHFPSLLPPTPYAAILTPWVHLRDSAAGIMSFVASDWMPKYLVANHCDALSGFMATKVLPSFAASGGGRGGRGKDEVADDARAMEAFGMTRARRNEVARFWLKLMFTEETSGANAEALLCAQKGPPTEERLGGVAKLRIQAVFVEDDAMIGEGGRKFFEDCWKGRRCGDGIEFTSSVAGGTTHDSIGDPEKGFLEVVLREARKALEGGEVGA
ncbi:hypothetical protein VE03_03072 [Pseudogymnoascus sp. 23342-1-I1]|nr:hypothetical protein VE03_03072 [Pseudogymnoascus sp. 23342-1-I1]